MAYVSSGDSAGPVGWSDDLWMTLVDTCTL